MPSIYLMFLMAGSTRESPSQCEGAKCVLLHTHLQDAWQNAKTYPLSPWHRFFLNVLITSHLLSMLTADGSSPVFLVSLSSEGQSHWHWAAGKEVVRVNREHMSYTHTNRESVNDIFIHMSTSTWYGLISCVGKNLRD